MDDTIVSRLKKIDVIDFNKEYCTVENDGQFYVVRIDDNTTYRPEEFKKAQASVRRFIKGKPVKLADEWLLDPRRLHFPRGFIFDPSIQPVEKHYLEENPTAFNLWQGYAVIPQEGDVTPFLDYVKNVICDEDENNMHYLMSWLANIIQQPGNKPGTAVVLRGEQGIGKSLFASCIGGILGDRTYMELNDPELVVGRFSGHLKGKLLICADEGAFTTAKAANKLKGMITSEKITLEAKHKNPITVDNHLRVMITGNDPQIITANHDERRYFVLNVSPREKNNADYWKHMWEWRDNGGLAALHHYLKRYDSHGVNLRTVPQTGALMEQKIASLDDAGKWLYAMLQRGYFGQTPMWSKAQSCDSIRACFAEFHGLKQHVSANDSRIGRALREILPEVKKERPRLRGSLSPRQYVFPPLDDCRRAFERYLGGKIDWQEPESNN